MSTVQAPPSPRPIADITTVKFSPVAQAGAGPHISGGEHLVLIVPSDEGELQAQAMENWFQACSTPEPFALELVGTRRSQGFVLRASSQPQLSMLCKQFQAQYPQAEIRRIAPADDPLRVLPGERALVGEFALAKSAWMPIKMFPAKALIEPGGDPLGNLLAAMETVQSGERMVSQLALVHAPDTWIAPDIRKAVEHPLQEERDQFATSVRSGEPSDVAQGWRIFLWVLGILLALLGYRWYREGAWLTLSLLLLTAGAAFLGWLIWWSLRGQKEIYDMKLVSEKLKLSAFYFHLRVIVIGREHTSSEAHLRERLQGMEVAYRQFSLASANSLILKRVVPLTAQDQHATTLCSIHHAFRPRHALLRLLKPGVSEDICNSLELSGLFHLPQQFTDLPLVKRNNIKHLLFAPEVARTIAQGQDPLPPVSIGVSKHRGYQVNVRLPYSTQFSHKFLLGRSRYGKSVLLQLLVTGVLQKTSGGTLPAGIFCIDPHRDLIFDLLKLIPPHRAGDVLLLDFTNTSHIVGLNPLDAMMGLSRDQMISSLMSCFEKIWEKYWGPRMAFFLKNICLLLITLNFQLCAQGRASEQYTLLDINPVLQYKDYATLVLNQLDRSESWHQELLAWFQHTYWTLPTNSSFRQEIILPILSKMGIFTDNLQLRRIFSQPCTTAPVHEAITDGKVVLCALSSRDMDEASVNVLGSTLINTLHYAFTRQQEVPLLERRKCAVFIDELQNFTGSQFSKLLSEDAKWGCSALFTTQSLRRLNQLQDGLQEMLFSNCDNLFAFNVSAADAKILEAEFQEKITPKHIISQPPLHCYARIAVPTHPLQFASIILAHPRSWDPSASQVALAGEIIRRHQARFLSATQCDQQHEVHLQKFLDVSLFADRIEKEADAIVDRRQKREEEREREAHISQQQHPPTGNASDTTSEHDDDRSNTGAPNAQQAAPSHPTGAPQRDTQTGEKRKRTRSRRHRRHKKTPAGAPPPGLQEDELEDEAEDEAADDTHLPADFQPSPGRWGVEGRERERGL